MPSRLSETLWPSPVEQGARTMPPVGGPSLQNLLEISRLDGAEERLTKVYEWGFERTKLLLQAILVGRQSSNEG